MDRAKKLAKENNIIVAAEEVFGKVGFHNAKMEDIAQTAGITKVTLYSYFQSKENLYMAIIYNAFQALTEIFYSTIDESRSKSGFESTLAIFNSFYQFCENNFLYSEAMLDYFSIIRNITRGSAEGESSLSESIFFNKIQDIQNLPLKLTVKEINRGMNDGSIKKDIEPMLHTIQGWTMVVGYIKLLIASGNNDSSLMNVDLKSLKKMSLNMAEKALQN
jgi:AcrR family transcriptional regulator